MSKVSLELDESDRLYNVGSGKCPQILVRDGKVFISVRQGGAFRPANAKTTSDGSLITDPATKGRQQFCAAILAIYSGRTML